MAWRARTQQPRLHVVNSDRGDRAGVRLNDSWQLWIAGFSSISNMDIMTTSLGEQDRIPGRDEIGHRRMLGSRKGTTFYLVSDEKYGKAVPGSRTADMAVIAA